eukprot:CAMPEP_0176443550 /NCGR_PEP_ID=MMETSP0127-20121128/22504_1 /TAXON_ID=938130 /ORGANISM="Platyophrya macrostoma, Strain WH" /LENGTH=610 /DNA_ID=CAMNT_0017828829 /DNA_START=72 /DNA_END=1904 /DNA_ORIENTATION=-
MAVRWQYRNNEQVFVDFAKKDVAQLEKAFARDDKTAHLTIKKGTYTIDLEHLTQTNDTTHTQRMIRRVSPILNSKKQHIWEWETSPGLFTPYDSETNDVIEKAFLQDALRAHIAVDVSAHDKRDFVVHFGHMHQQNADGTNTRAVRRVVRDVKRADDDEPSRQAVLDKLKMMSPKKRPREEPDSVDVQQVVSSAAEPPKSDSSRPPFSFTKDDVLSLAKEATEASWKTVEGSVMVLPQIFASSNSLPIKIAGFDMDDTLVMPPSGATFPKSRTDWKWLHASIVPKLKELHDWGYRVVIFSNQSGIGNKGWDESKAKDIRGKIIDLQKSAGIPIGAVIATKEDNFRKPSTAMWDTIFKQYGISEQPTSTQCVTIDASKSFYCGAGRHVLTMAGRKKDFSCSDRKFAYNLGIQFFTPEELFLGRSSESFDWDGVSPEKLRALPTSYPKAAYHSTTTEMVIFCGFPGCGKSTFFQRFFSNAGYQHVNRDTLKTPEKCVAAATAALAQKRSVVIDNTNPSPEDRAKYISVAKKANVPVRCFVFLHDSALANHMNILRARLGITARVSSIAYNMFKSKFQAPTVEEGFTEVISINPVADFQSLPADACRLFFQLS